MSNHKRNIKIPSVGSLHTGVRDFFKKINLGSSLLSKVSEDNPTLMRKKATKSNMHKLVSIENSRVKNGTPTTKGDYLAKFVTPIRKPAVDFVLSHTYMSKLGMKEMFENKTGYGPDIRENIHNSISGTFDIIEFGEE